MTDARTEITKALNTSIEQLDHVISEGLAGFILVNGDYTLAVIQTTDDQLRLGSIGSHQVYISHVRANACKAARRWNGALNDQQRAAGCEVTAVVYLDAAIHARKQIVKLLEQLNTTL